MDSSDMCIVMTPHVSQKLQVQLHLFIYESCGYSQALLTYVLFISLIFNINKLNQLIDFVNIFLTNYEISFYKSIFIFNSLIFNGK